MSDNIMNENTATTTETTTTTTTEASVNTGGVLDLGITNDFRSSLSEDLRNDPTLNGIKNVEDLTKGYIHAQRKLGGRIPIPSEDASTEVIDEFNAKLESVPGVIRLPKADDPKGAEKMAKIYNALGRPASPDRYELELPEGLPIDTEFVAAVKDEAHKAGLNNAQLNALANLEVERSRQQMALLEKQKANVKSFLEKTWGNAFEENKANYKAVMSKYAEKYPDAVAELTNGYAGNNPIVILMAAELGAIHAEKGAVGVKNGVASGSRTPEQAQQQIIDIRGNKAHAYHNAKDPAHDAAVLHMANLYKDAFPEAKE